MADNRITKKRLRNHLTYGWWKYLLAVVLCVFGVDMLFSMTAYRSPAEKKIELYMLSGYCDTQALEAELWPQIQAAFPEQEELTAVNINLTGSDIYAPMQFATYVSAQQGDVCLMPAEELRKLTEDGADEALVDLTPYVESGAIDTKGIDLTNGVLADSQGGTGIYAIPADSLYGLLGFSCDPKDSYLCVLWYTKNADTAAGVINQMIENYSMEKPEGYDEQKASQPGGALY